MEPASYLPGVREQYESLPFPPRDPDDERRRLVYSTAESLPVLNHRCFAGRQTFDRGFRVLIAGGGTGDSLIQLAEQLDRRDAEVVYLDLSRASMEVARERARVRGLDGIRWVHGSILDLGRLDLGTFDYINCTGVLHHLADPDAGLRQLASVLADDGAMGLMVYGIYGRTAVYQIQQLMRLIHGDEADLEQRVRDTRAVLDHLPPTNWFARSRDLFGAGEYRDDAGLVDLFLHEQDRAYSVPEIYAWLERCGLELVDLAGPRQRYDPDLVAPDHPLRARWAGRAEPVRRAIAEILRGDLATHSFYVARSARHTPRLDDPGMVPFLWGTRSHREIAAELESRGCTTLGNAETPVTIRRSPWTASIFRHLDGTRSASELMAAVVADCAASRPDPVAVAVELGRLYDVLGGFDQVLLRHEEVPEFPDGAGLQRRRFG